MVRLGSMVLSWMLGGPARRVMQSFHTLWGLAAAPTHNPWCATVPIRMAGWALQPHVLGNGGRRETPRAREPSLDVMSGRWPDGTDAAGRSVA